VNNKGKGIAHEPPKRLEGKKCSKCHGFGYFQADCPNRKALTIREVEEIQALEDESSEEEMSMMCLPWSQRFLIKRAKGNKFSILDAPLEVRFVS